MSNRSDERPTADRPPVEGAIGPIEADATSSLPVSPPTESNDFKSKKHRLKYLWLPVGAVAIGALAIWFGLQRDSSDDVAETEPLRAVRAEVRDLVEFTVLTGDLKYSSVVSATSANEGAVTDIIGDGTPLVRGDVLYRVDTEPVVLLYGDDVLYRSMSIGDVGDDVLMLEQNLAALGYHATEDSDGNQISTGFLVDGEYTSATSDALSRWQSDLGLEETGDFDPSGFMVVGGPSIVSNVAVEKGAQLVSGDDIADLNVERSETGLFSKHPGEVELLLEPEAEIATGDIVYVENGDPISGILTEAELDRNLYNGVENGTDIEALEQMLSDLGFNAEGSLEVDQTFDENTTAALVAWQENLDEQWPDVVVDGVFSKDDVVVVDPRYSQVANLVQEPTATLGTGAQLYIMNSSSGDRIVEASLDAADRNLVAVGDAIEVEFSDETVIGVVESLATSADQSADGDGGLPMEVRLTEIPESAAGLTEITVDVKITTNKAEDVVSVPVSALIAQGDNVFTVETTDGTVTSFETVEPGLYAEGFVEVNGIEAGTAVLIPS